MRAMPPALMVRPSLLPMPLTAEELPLGKIPTTGVPRPGSTSYDWETAGSLRSTIVMPQGVARGDVPTRADGQEEWATWRTR